MTEILTENSKTRRYYYDLLFIDDGSKDNTIEHIQHLAEYDEHVKYISFSRNFGKEAAMIAGFQHSVNVDAVVMIDGDLQHPPEFIPKMVEMYQQGFDQVVAKRDRSGENVARKTMSKLYYKLINSFVEEI